MEKKPCPKCQGNMVQGFVPDAGYMETLVGHWYKGAPKLGFFGDTKVPVVGGLPIAAFRCDQCGFLEFYANIEYAAS